MNKVSHVVTLKQIIYGITCSFLLSVSFFLEAQSCTELFGLTSPSSTSIEPITIDSLSGDFSIITTLSSPSNITPNIGNTTYNANTQSLIFQTLPNEQMQVIATGNENNSTTFTFSDTVAELEYNCNNNTLYGLSILSTTSVQVVTIDISSNSSSPVTATINLGGEGIASGMSTIDNINNRYFFITQDIAGNATLHIVDLTVGTSETLSLGFVPIDMEYDFTLNQLLFLDYDLNLTAIDMAIASYPTITLGTVAASPSNLPIGNMAIDPFNGSIFFVAEQTSNNFVLYTINSSDASFVDPANPFYNLPYQVTELESVLPCSAVPEFTYEGTCLGDITYFENLSIGGNQWLWDFGDSNVSYPEDNTSTDTNPIHVYTQAGTYTVTLTIDGCIGSNSISYGITMTNPPNPNLSSPDDLSPEIPDTITTCANSVSLVADLYPDATYFWNVGPDDNEITASVSTWYSVNISINDGACSVLDSIYVNLGADVENPEIWIENDLLLCADSNGNAELSAEISGSSYEWLPNGETTQTISISSPGTYSVTVTQDGCNIEDAVTVDVVTSPNVDLGPDLTECGDIFTLDAGVAGASYEWSTGDDTQSITVASSGTYAVTVSIGTTCFDSDTIVLDLISFTPPNLGPDTLKVCETDPLTLDATTEGATDYEWSTGATSPTIDVTNAAPGIYWVDVRVGSCEARDSILVEFGPTVSLDLGPDLTICAGESAVLSSGLTDNIVHVWNNGAFSNSIAVDSSGLYSLLVDNGYCVASDEVLVNIQASIPINLGPDQTICSTLNESITLDAGTGSSFLWQPNGETSQSINVTQANIYSVAVTDENGCTQEGSITIGNLCETNILFPTAFTPNNDNINDEFKAYGQFIEGYKLSIYNRWGDMLFQTDDIDYAWDGSHQGEQQPIGVYIWYATYTDNSGKQTIEKGNVSLIK